MNECCLCAGQTKYVWSQLILEKYDVGYFECLECGSLQSETPYWLDEAYSQAGTGYDTGACQRSIICALAMSTAFEMLGIRPETKCLDCGAGMGLYARMMRDRGWSYFAYEKYVFPFYMDKFCAGPTDTKWGVVSAFEVFEHLPNPGDSIDLILGSAKDYVFFTTECWENQGNAWHYLDPMHGQHVFSMRVKRLNLSH